LPKSGYFKNIPAGSCMRIYVKEATQCERIHCNVPKSGSLVSKNFHVVNNEVKYKLMVEGKAGAYYIS